MTYRVVIQPSAEKEVKRLDARVRLRVDDYIATLADDPYRRGTQKLASGLGFRGRVGDYRVIYLVDDNERLVTVTGVSHRREAYRKR